MILMNGYTAINYMTKKASPPTPKPGPVTLDQRSAIEQMSVILSI